MAKSSMNQQSGVGYGEAQVFNTSAPIQLFLQQQMIEKKREDDVLKQLGDQLSKLDVSGIRPVDMKDISRLYDEYKNYAIQNKDAFANPSKNFDRYVKGQEMFNNLLNATSLAKQEVEAQKKIFNLSASRPDVYNPEQVKKILSTRQNVSVLNPNYKPLNDFDIFNAMDYNLDKLYYDPLRKAHKEQTFTIEGKAPDELYKLSGFKDYTPLISDAAHKYDLLPTGAQKKFEALFNSLSPDDLQQMNQQIQKILPPEIRDNIQIKSPKDYAIATYIMQRPTQELGVVPNQVYNERASRSMRAQSLSETKRYHDYQMAKENGNGGWAEAMNSALSEGDWDRAHALSQNIYSSKNKGIVADVITKDMFIKNPGKYLQMVGLDQTGDMQKDIRRFIERVNSNVSSPDEKIGLNAIKNGGILIGNNYFIGNKKYADYKFITAKMENTLPILKSIEKTLTDKGVLKKDKKFRFPE